MKASYYLLWGPGKAGGEGEKEGRTLIAKGMQN